MQVIPVLSFNFCLRKMMNVISFYTIFISYLCRLIRKVLQYDFDDHFLVIPVRYRCTYFNVLLLPYLFICIFVHHSLLTILLIFV